ncbi:MAG TPA: hypothetical protein VFI54_06265 [Solirubrobacteraceae bacterium]|nr:hypothetical protein [Solirubrobacteraceae bacterium]
MSWALNNITAPDAYTSASTLQNLPFPGRVNLDVTNQAIYWQLQQASGPTGMNTEGTWQREVFMGPGSRTLFRAGVRGIRVRAAVPAASLPAGATQARVTIEAIE